MEVDHTEQSAHTDLDRRRYSRRIRRQQADMAAAVAGALVGVSACQVVDISVIVITSNLFFWPHTLVLSLLRIRNQ